MRQVRASCSIPAVNSAQPSRTSSDILAFLYHCHCQYTQNDIPESSYQYARDSFSSAILRQARRDNSINSPAQHQLSLEFRLALSSVKATHTINVHHGGQEVG